MNIWIYKTRFMVNSFVSARPATPCAMLRAQLCSSAAEACGFYDIKARALKERTQCASPAEAANNEKHQED